MTIKELCDKHLECKKCSFFKACPFCARNGSLYLTDANNEECTKAIIETARILREQNNDN